MNTHTQAAPEICPGSGNALRSNGGCGCCFARDVRDPLYWQGGKGGRVSHPPYEVAQEHAPVAFSQDVEDARRAQDAQRDIAHAQWRASISAVNARLAKNADPKANGWLTVYMWEDPAGTKTQYSPKQGFHDVPATHRVAVYFKEHLKLQDVFVRSVSRVAAVEACKDNLRKGGHECGSDITYIDNAPPKGTP